MKNNFSTPGFLWPLLMLLCLIIILTGIKTVLKKTNWEKSRQDKIFFGTTFILVIWIGLLTILSYKGFFTDFNELPPRPALVMLIPLPIIFLIAFLQYWDTTPANSPFALVSIYAIIQNNC
jgi:hypothetical protein